MPDVRSLPDAVLLSDVSPADWVVGSLASWDWPLTVACLVPAVFEAYARILPPAADREGGPRWRWSRISEMTGVPLTAETTFDTLAGRDRATPWSRPPEGGLETPETEVLVRVLAATTTTPQTAYFAIWEGFGEPETEAWWSRPARVRAEHRAYHLITGPVDLAVRLSDLVAHRSANLWWPQDRAWLVATEIDGYATYVGGTREAVGHLIASPDLDAVLVRPDTPLDPS